MYHENGNIALSILLECSNYVMKNIKHVTSDGNIIDFSENNINLKLLFRRTDSSLRFCEIEVFVIRVTENMLAISVFAELSEMALVIKPKFEKININSLMEKYQSLKPVITEGIMHNYGTIENGVVFQDKLNSTRTLKIRFGVYDQIFETEEGDLNFAYNTSEIGSRVIPYVQALKEIHEILYPGPPEGFENTFI